jgi:hypothetical protein
MTALVSAARAAGAWSEHSATATQGLDEMVGIITLVGEQCFGLDKRQQRVGLRDVMDLPTREAGEVLSSCASSMASAPFCTNSRICRYP